MEAEERYTRDTGVLPESTNGVGTLWAREGA